MLGTTQQAKYFTVIEWILFFGLCGLSGVFMHGVLYNFFSGKTSFSESEEVLTELPTVVFCFTKLIGTKNVYPEYEYGSDFKVEYRLYIDAKRPSVFLKEGENTILGEHIHLETIKTLYRGNCFKFTSSFAMNYHIIKKWTHFKLYFSNSFSQEDLPTSQIFMTSEKNSYGIVINEWMNGKAMKTQIKKGMQKIIIIRSEKRTYLPKISKCHEESFFECFSSTYTTKLKESHDQCSLVSLPSLQNLSTCNFKETDKERRKQKKKQFWNHFDEVSVQCPNKICSTSEYLGEESYYEELMNKNVTVQFSYMFFSNSTISYEEYLVYDLVSTIGSVGGTLGMCIGFSFSGMISPLINFLQHGIMFIKAKKKWKINASEENHGLHKRKDLMNYQNDMAV